MRSASFTERPPGRENLVNRRRFLAGVALSPLLRAANVLAEGADSVGSKTVEFSIKGYDRVLLPREHGQLAALREPFVRRYPSRDHCMQMAAFLGQRTALLVHSKDPTGGVADWEILPNEKLRIHFHGAVPEVEAVTLKPTLEDIASVYRDWALRQPWIKNRSRARERLSFISVASSPDLALQRKHLLRIAKLTPPPRGVWFTQWRRFPFDTMYPDYRPAHPVEFAELLRDLRVADWTCFPYVNGLVFDERFAPFSRVGLEVALRSRGGASVSYNRSMAYLKHACPGAKAWQDTIVEARNSLLDADGQPSNGVYLDMLLAAPPILCWAEGHGHQVGDAHSWQSGIRSILRRTSGRLLTEGCAEVYLDLVDHVLMHLYTAKPDAVPLWRLVYGGQVSSVGWTYPESVGSEGAIAEISRARIFGVDSLGTPWLSPAPEALLLSPPVEQVISDHAGKE